MTDFQTCQVWEKGETALRCIERTQETHDSVTFILAGDASLRFSYLPGQFILVGPEIGGKKHYRAYTLCSSPSRPETLAITVKRVQGGLVSNWMLDHFHVGNVIQCLPPAGDFCLPQGVPPRNLVLLSSGCGITPMLSMSHWLLDGRHESTIHFIYSARDQANIIYKDELLEIARRHPNFHLHLMLSREVAPAIGRSGRLSRAVLDELLPDLTDAHAYICGPQEYMDDVAGWLLDMGLPPSHVIRENFALDIPALQQASEHKYALEVPSFGRKTEIADGQTLLDVLEQERLPIIGACRTGVCGACKCKVLEGQVDTHGNKLLTATQAADGYVLACCTTAKSDLKVAL